MKVLSTSCFNHDYWSLSEGQDDYFSTGKCLPKDLINSTDDENKKAFMKTNGANYELATVCCETDLCMMDVLVGLNISPKSLLKIDIP
jgi:hypothetical protein